MNLPKTFQFSATSLQDYVDCPRRFQLRFLLRIAWPAPLAEPVGEQEHHARLARDFHRLVHQHLLGLPLDALSASVHDPDLKRWWQAYLMVAPTLGDARLLPEVVLSAPLGGYRVVAQYDAIVARVQQRSPVQGEFKPEPALGRPFLIIDWKTYRRRPTRTWLAQRLQTRLYPAMLVQSGAPVVNQSHIQPDDVEMCYWLAEYPHEPQVFPYNTATYQADLDYLTALITEIDERIKLSGHRSNVGSEAVADETWSLTSNLDECRYCNYRSLCGRGGVAGPLTDYADEYLANNVTGAASDLDLDLDWGQVQEVAY